MLKNEFINYAIILFYLGERFIELSLNQINRRFLISKYLVRLRYPRESRQMRLFHSFWFVALIAENYWHGKLLTGYMFNLTILILLMAQILRWYAIFTLGMFWSVDIYQMTEHPIVNKGPYVYIRHPNYLAVILEFIFLPLLLGCPMTLIGGTVLNYFVLKRRIKLEEESLEAQSSAHIDQSYHSVFMGKNKFIFKIPHLRL